MRGRSFITTSLAIGALAGLVTLVCTASVGAQTIPNPDPPSQPGMRIGPLALSPAIRLSEFGHDSNVYNRSDDSNPVGDFISTLSPSVDAWFRLGHVRASGRSQFDMYYFKALPDLRAVDSDNAVQVDLVVNRARLFAIGRRENTQRRQSLEIDAIAQRHTDAATVGAEVRLTGKTSLGVSVSRSSLAYAPNSLYLGTDLGSVLNHKSSGEGIGLRYAATRLTTFAVDVAHERAEFDTAADRNAGDLRITPSVEFSPFALVSGRASLGFIKRTFANGTAPFTGTTALVDLSYVLMGRTRFTIAANRSLEYSYLTGPTDYVVAGGTLSVTQRLGESWDVGGSYGRSRLSYRQLSPLGGAAAARLDDETVLTSEVDVGYNVRHARVGVYAEHRERNTDLPAQNRGYHRFRIGSTVKYDF